QQFTNCILRPPLYFPRKHKINLGGLVVGKSSLMMIAVAAVFGLLAVFVAQSWLNRQAESRLRSIEANKKPISEQTLVVASRALRFGNAVEAAALREVPWPQDAIPAGSFKTIQELTGSGRRVVLTAIEANEPVLASKITGAGQRATLSATITPG